MKTSFCFVMLGVLIYMHRTDGVTSALEEQYIGCYKNATITNTTTSTSLTLESCLNLCNIFGSTYAALQNGTICACADIVNISTTEDKCSVPCPGNRSQICGGQSNEYSVYSVCRFGYYGVGCIDVTACHCKNQIPCDRSTGICPNGCEGNWTGVKCDQRNTAQQYIGCFRDDESRATHDLLNNTGLSNNDIDLCMHICDGSSKKTYLGLQYGTDCNCGDKYGSYGAAPESDCNDNQYRCPGNRSQQCGGYFRNSIYSVCPNGTYGRYCGERCHCANETRCNYSNGTCNITGSCSAGWKGGSCNERDCNINNGNCSANEICQNVNLQFTTVAQCVCSNGYYRNSVWGACDQDINECEVGNPCNTETTICVNTIGSFKCSCKPGYQTTPASNTACIDINECSGNNSCNATTETCVNTPGSYNCTALSDPSNPSNPSNPSGSSPTSGGSTGSDRTSVIIGAVVGCVGGVIVILVILAIAFICSRRKKSEDQDFKSLNNLPLETITPGSTVLATHQNGGSVYDMKIKTSELKDYVESRRVEGGFDEEFKLIPKMTNNSRTHANRKEFKKFNRFKNIVPYEYNQIHLMNRRTENSEGYINASSISGYNKERMIATQGPNKATLVDFWAMILEQNVGVIVMITNLIENDKDKCERYWPSAGTHTYGDVNVTLEYEEIWNSYTLRNFLVWKDEANRLQISQWHYTDWPDHKVPSDVRGMLVFRRRVRQSMSADKSTVVHCSAGVGRTGCFIAIDYLLEEAKAEDQVDVSGCVRKLRNQRSNMVQTAVQYEFIYTALALEFTLGSTYISSDEFETTLNQLLVMDSTGLSKLQNEFQVLEEESNKGYETIDEKLLTKARQKKKWNSCLVSISNKKTFQVSRIPDPPEIPDFWKFAVDQYCKIIVFLDDAKDRPRNYFPSKNHTIEIANATITFMFESTEEFGTVMKLSVAKTSGTLHANPIYANSPIDNYEVTILHVTSVKADAIDYEIFQELYATVKGLRENIYGLEGSTKELVLCRTGCYQSGFYIAATVALDMLERYNDIDIFNIVQELKKVQPRFIPTLVSYNDLYVTVGRHLRRQQLNS